MQRRKKHVISFALKKSKDTYIKRSNGISKVISDTLRAAIKNP